MPLLNNSNDNNNNSNNFPSSKNELQFIQKVCQKFSSATKYNNYLSTIVSSKKLKHTIYQLCSTRNT